MSKIRKASKLAALALFFVVGGISQSAQAQTLQWKGIQTLQQMRFEFAQIMSVSALHYWDSQKKAYIVGGYLGPTFPISQGTFFSPQIGIVANLAGNDYAIGSLRGGFSRGPASIYALTEAYVAGEKPIQTLNYISLDYKEVDSNQEGWNIGVHSEGQSELVSTVGPHIGLSRRTAGCGASILFWNGELQYHGTVATDEPGYMLRITSTMRLGRIRCEK